MQPINVRKVIANCDILADFNSTDWLLTALGHYPSYWKINSTKFV